MSLLLRCGFLIRHPGSGGLYYFSVANTGTVVRGIQNGRKVPQFLCVVCLSCMRSNDVNTFFARSSAVSSCILSKAALRLPWPVTVSSARADHLLRHHFAQEVLGVLARRRRPHAFLRELRELAARPLRSSPLGLRFHLRDLLGSGTLVRVATPAGEVVRPAKRGT